MSVLSVMEYRRRLGVVAGAEIEAAQVGGEQWSEFVRWAEVFVGDPWVVIRDQLNRVPNTESTGRTLC